MKFKALAECHIFGVYRTVGDEFEGPDFAEAFPGHPVPAHLEILSTGAKTKAPTKTKAPAKSGSTDPDAPDPDAPDPDGLGG